MIRAITKAWTNALSFFMGNNSVGSLDCFKDLSPFANITLQYVYY